MEVKAHMAKVVVTFALELNARHGTDSVVVAACEKEEVNYKELVEAANRKVVMQVVVVPVEVVVVDAYELAVHGHA